MTMTSSWGVRIRNTWLAVLAVGMLGTVVHEWNPNNNIEGRINAIVSAFNPGEQVKEYWIGGYMNPVTGKGLIKEGAGFCPPTLRDSSIYLPETCQKEKELSTPETKDW